LKCFTIFSMYDIISSGNYCHPITRTKIPEEAIERAKELIDLYDKELNLFKEVSIKEFSLRNKLNYLFGKFRSFGIYLEEDWILGINDKDKLKEMSYELVNIAKRNNISIVPPSFFINDTIQYYHSIIFQKWEMLFNTCPNETTIWIIALSIAKVCPQVMERYPDLKFMI
jgi:hypothetical protein